MCLKELSHPGLLFLRLLRGCCGWRTTPFYDQINQKYDDEQGKIRPLLASLWGPETHSPLFSIFFPSHREWVPSFQLKQSDAVPEGWGAVWSCFLSGDLAHFSTQWLLQPPPRQAKEALLRGQLAGMAFILILGLVTVRQVCVSLGGSPLVFVQF